MDFDEIIFNVVMFGFIGGAVFVLVGLCFGWYNPVDSTNQSVVLSSGFRLDNCSTVYQHSCGASFVCNNRLYNCVTNYYIDKNNKL